MQTVESLIIWWAGAVGVTVALTLIGIAAAWFLVDAVNLCARHVAQIVRFSVVRYWMVRMEREGLLTLPKHYKRLVSQRKPHSVEDFKEIDSQAYAAEWAAQETLERLGYTYAGGQYWKPPLGQAPNFDLLDSLHRKIAALELDRDEWRDAATMANQNAANEERRRQVYQDERDKLVRELNRVGVGA